MDGVAMVSQCPIPPGGSFTHVFTVDSPGTHWYHSRMFISFLSYDNADINTCVDDKAQYPDGLRAPMIVHDRAHEAQLGYDEEFVFSVSDWYPFAKSVGSNITL
jgi:iron transport multicopper oxidase